VTEALENSIKRSQLALAVIERAMQDPLGWTIGGGGVSVDAQVVIAEDGASFWIRYPDGIGDRNMDRVVLCHRGEALWVSAITAPLTGAFEVEITLLHTALTEPARP
jgi:hypothetical protein